MCANLLSGAKDMLRLLAVILCDRAMQNALHDLIAHLFHCTAGEFCKRPTAEPLKHPAQESDDEYKPKVTKGFFF